MTGKIIMLTFCLFVALAGVGLSSGSNVVEILYLPHPPAEAVVREVEDVLRRFPQFRVEKYSFDAPNSREPVMRYGIKEHMPVVIFINGKYEFSLGERQVVFKNFPKGNAFVPMFEGNWSYEDLAAVLQNLVRGA